MCNMNNNCSSCADYHEGLFCNKVSLGMGYIPWQTWDNVYDLNRGLQAGTIFPCLDKPFMGRCLKR